MAELRKCHCCGTITDKDVCPRCCVSVINDGIKPESEASPEATPKADAGRTTKTRKTTHKEV